VNVKNDTDSTEYWGWAKTQSESAC
jgi:hypothetical protein